MEQNTAPTTTNDKQIVVDVPEDRVAEFHAFFARFLAGPRRGPGRRGRHGRPHHRGHHGHRCERVSPEGERGEAAGGPDEISEV